MNIKKVNKILIPQKPHLDPIAAIYLLRQYGQDKFIGINEAEIIFWEHAHDPSPEEVKKLEAENTVLIDVGGGSFDHHNDKNKIQETATSLVAQYLEIDTNPELATLINYIREDDLEGLHNRFGELAFLLKNMYKQNIPTKQVIDQALQLLDYFQANQKEWHYVVKNEFLEKGTIYKIKRFQRKLKVCVVESDNVQVGNYALTTSNISVVVQKRSTGHVVILTNKNHKINISEIVTAIRKKELELSGYTKPIDIRSLQFEGKNSLIPNWFYHKSLNSFLNGSDALQKTEPTKIPFENIVQFVLYGLSTDESELCDCAKGGKNCPYKNYGFRKCFTEKSKPVVNEISLSQLSPRLQNNTNIGLK